MDSARYKKAVDSWRMKNIHDGKAFTEALGSFGEKIAVELAGEGCDPASAKAIREAFRTGCVTSYTGNAEIFFSTIKAKNTIALMARSVDKGTPPGMDTLLQAYTCLHPGAAFCINGRSSLMELLSEMHEIPKASVHTAAAFFLAKMYDIRPFPDDRLQTPILVMNCLLAVNDHPPVLIRQNDKRMLLSALDAWEDSKNLDPLIDFLESRTVDD